MTVSIRDVRRSPSHATRRRWPAATQRRAVGGAYRLIQLMLSGVVALVAIVAAAGVASAHAELVVSNPANGEVLAAPPKEVTIEFSESVTIGAGYLRVLNDKGDRVDTGNAIVDGVTASVALPEGLADGGYIATYRVVSADSHPVTGAIAFAVGDALPPEISSSGTRLDGASDDPVIAVAYPVIRWLGYAGLALVAGSLLLALLDPALRNERALRRPLWWGFDAALGSTVAGGLVQGPYAAGRGIGSVFDPTLLSATLETDLGRWSAVRLILLGVFGVLLWEWLNAERTKRLVTWCGLGAGAAIAATYAASGHAVADPAPPLTIVVGTVHLSAVAAWIGGLAVIWIAVIRARGSMLSDDERAAVVRRFSPVAASFVALIVVTGVIEAWIRLGSWGALWGTTYGRLLLAKSGLLVIALVAALITRRMLGARRRPQTLARSVAYESIAGIAAIAVAAVLVATPPGRDVYDVARDTQVTFVNSYVAQVSLEPARQGPNVLHVYLYDRTQQLASIETVTVTVEANQIGPLEITARNVGRGHFIATGVELPVVGRWTVTISFAEPGFGVVEGKGTIDVE